MKKALFILLLTLWGAKAHAANSVFLAPTSAGGNTGLDCSNAKSFTYFNSGGNWSGSPTGIQIGPDTTVHLCSGTYNGTVNTNLIAFQGDGTSGHPVTLLFDSGAIVQGPAFGRLGNAGIVSFGHSHIIIDLGTNGIVQNTSNGGGLANHLAGNLLYVTGATDVVIQHGTFANTCVHQQGVDNSGCNTSGSDDAAIFIDSSSNVRINTTIHDAMAGIFENPGANDQNNTYGGTDASHLMTITNCNWGIAIGAANTGNVATNPTVQFVDISNAVKWDEPGNGYHHNGIFMFVGQGSGHIDNPTINSVYIHGDMGDNDTSYIFFDNNTGTINNLRLFNFVLASTSAHTPKNAYITGDGQTGGLIANGTIDGNNIGGTSEGCIASNFGASGATIKNVICKNAVTYIWLNNPATLAASDFNSFFGAVTSVQFKNQTVNYSSLAQWQAGTGFDANSIVTNPLLSSSYVPNAGSPVISTGANLTSLGIAALNVDFNGSPRPAAPSNWTRGAKNPTSATVTISPTSHDYGTIVQHVTSAPFTYTVTNVSGGTLNLSTPCCSISGTNGPDFVISSKTCADNQPLVSGGTCTVSVTFTPNTTSLEQAVLQVGGATGGTAALSGTGQAPATAAMTVTPNPVNFYPPGINVGSSSGDMTVTFTNTGTADFQFVNTTSFITVSSAVFVRDSSTCLQNGVLHATQSCVAAFSFHPVAAGAVSATVTANGNVTGTTTLNGTGVAPCNPLITVSPTSFDFGKQLKGTTSALHNFTITNGGTCNATLGNSFFSFTGGSNPTDFGRVSPGGSDCTPGQVLVPAQTCLISVAFTPSVSGFESGGLNILSNATTVSSSLTGTGTFPIVTIIPAPINFGSINQGTPSAPQVVTIQNSGTATLTGISLSVSGPSAGYYTIPSNTCGATLASTASCTANIVFTPGAAGLFTDTFNVNGNAPGSAQLTGTGVSVAPIITLSPRPVNFPNSVTGIPTSGVVVTVSNTGSAIQSSLGYTITTGDAADFTRSANGCGATLAAGSSCMMTFIFTSSLPVRAESTLLTITGTATANVTFNGAGQAAGPGPAPAPLFVQIDLFPLPRITITGKNFVPGTTQITIDGVSQSTVCPSVTSCTTTLAGSTVLLPGFGVIGHVIGIK